MKIVRSGVITATDDERGTGGSEVLALGFLVLFSGTLIVMSAWGVIDAKMAALAASREGARSAVESPQTSEGASPTKRARKAAEQSWIGQGRSIDNLTFSLSGSLGRCEQITAITETEIKPIRMPWLGSWGTLKVVARHSEIVDPYRSGLDGEANCA